MVLVSIVILSHKYGTGLINTLNSLKKSTFQDFEVIIVDNGSLRGTTTHVLDVARELQLRVKIIRLDKNLGVTVGYNIGIKAASSEIVALLHDDVVVSPQWLAKCVSKLLENSKYGAVQGKIYLGLNQRVLDSCGCIIDGHGCEHDQGQGEVDNGQYDGSCEVFSASGVASVFRKSAIESAGHFDETFLSGLDDLDLCWRIRLRGFRIVYVPNAIAYHKRSGTWKSSSELYRTLAFEFAKTRIYVPFKNFALKNFFQNLPIILLHFIGGFLLNLTHKDVKIAICYPCALFWFIAHFPKLAKERVKVQLRIRRVKDDEVFSVSVNSCNLVNYTIRKQFLEML